MGLTPHRVTAGAPRRRPIYRHDSIAGGAALGESQAHMFRRILVASIPVLVVHATEEWDGSSERLESSEVKELR
jgi:hypothetical protein